jgi:hypothetical protein
MLLTQPVVRYIFVMEPQALGKQYPGIPELILFYLKEKIITMEQNKFYPHHTNFILD